MTSIIDEIRKLGCIPKFKSGFEYSSPCPRCGGKDRFIMWTDSGRYWCRQCKIKGDLIRFLRDFKGLSFAEARNLTGKNSNIQNCRIASEKRNYQSALWKRQAEAFVDWAAKSLLNNTKMLKRLEVIRGIKPETAGKYRLGYCYKDFYRQRKDWGLAERYKTNGKPKKLWLPRGWVIPKFNNKGEVARLRFRRQGGKPKYYLLPTSEISPLILGAPKAEYAVLIESELDTFLLSQEVKEKLFIVATGSVTTKLDRKLIEILFNKKVLVSYDNDQAGIKAGKSDIEKLKACYLPPVEGKDITESFLNGINLDDWFKAGQKLYKSKLLG